MAEKKTTTKKKSESRRASDGGTYLVIADDTPEFHIALSYAVCLAKQRHGHVAMARIIEPADFVHWGGVEDVVREEARTKAEKELDEIAGQVKEETGLTPSLIIREGKRADEIIAIAKGNPAIVGIVVGSSADASSGPGPMINHFTSKGFGDIPVPLIIVPGHISKEDINRMA